jgi:hypothetical protein
MYNYVFNDDLRNMNMTNNSYNMIPKMMNTSLYNPLDGYNKGNLFPNLYSQYKNYKPVELKADNEREQILLDLSKVAFAAHELNLYLDLNPNDESMLTLFNDYRKEANALMRQYEAKYGPLNIKSDSLEKGPFAWVNNMWPWEDRYYV